MITTMQLAQKFETELNALLTYPNLYFKIWADVGKRTEAGRVGNTVNAYIDGNMKVSASSISPNALVIGANQLLLEFNVMVNPPKTTLSQTADDLAPIINGQYWFVQEIAGILGGYFQKYQAFELEDEQRNAYSVGMVAGVGIPQTVDLQAWTDNSVPVDVYIELNIGQGSLISLDVQVELDGQTLPFQTFTPDRTGVLDPTVYSGEDKSEALLTSSAFVAECSIPTNTVYSSSHSAVEYLLGGTLNEAHFLKVPWGETAGLYLVTFTRATGGLQGVAIASVTFRIAEVRDDPDMINVPSTFQVGFFEVASSTISSLTFSVSADCLGYIGRKTYELTAGQSVTVPLTPNDIVYDDDSDEYRVYLITSAAVTVTATGYAFEVA